MEPPAANDTRAGLRYGRQEQSAWIETVLLLLVRIVGRLSLGVLASGW